MFLLIISKTCFSFFCRGQGIYNMLRPDKEFLIYILKLTKTGQGNFAPGRSMYNYS